MTAEKDRGSLEGVSTEDCGYVDAAGRPVLRLSIVGFLDILGFSRSIVDTAGSAESQQLLDRIIAAIQESRQYVRRNLTQEFASRPNRWGLKFFSDNLVVGYPCDAAEGSAAAAAQFVIRCAQRYQLRMILNGFFLRGGLAQGDVCITDEIIFGKGLLDSYLLESKTSIVPRVILTEPIMNLLAESCRGQAAGLCSDIGNSICRDIDGWWFVSYLEAAIDGQTMDWELVEGHKQAILRSLSGFKHHEILPKYGWACRYHNMFCHGHRDTPGYSDEYRIERVDEHSTICRLGDVDDATARP